MKRQLRWMAAVGPLFVLLADVSTRSNANADHGTAIGVLVLVAIATALALTALLRDACLNLKYEPDLLVPLGLAVTLREILSQLQRIPGLGSFLETGETLSFFSVTLTASTSVAVEIVIAAAYATWTVALIVQAAKGEKVDLLA